MKEIYRFRKTDNLLNWFNELQNQEIYFATQDELNDPMEGYRDVFWQGDKIVWENFIKNYVRSFEQLFKLYSVVLESKPINENDIIDTYELVRSHTPINHKIGQTISEKIFEISFIKDLPNSLSNRISPIRRSELLTYLQFIHPFVINIVSQTYFENGFLSYPFLSKELSEYEKLIKVVGNLPGLFNKIKKDNITLSTESFLTEIEIFSQSNILLARKSQNQQSNNENSQFLILEFPSKYLDKLTQNIYPPWFSASFLSDCKNSAIWGHYGDNHKGVCLIFKTSLNDNNEYFLNLETEYGYNTGPIIGMQPHVFRKVIYSNAPTEIDFFRSIGRLTKLELDKLWYKDSNGNMSICGQHLIDNEVEWRDSYWNKFTNSISIKLKEWDYENEYRLVIHGDFIDYTNRNSRKLKYQFEDLKGVIFGIRTSIIDKLEIMKIIEQKCNETKRLNFDFLQAYYSNDTKKIETYKIPSK